MEKKSQLTPGADTFITAYEKFNEFTADFLALLKKQQHTELKTAIDREGTVFSGILSEGFNLPSLYNSPNYKMRMTKAATTFMSLIFFAEELNMISVAQAARVKSTFNQIIQPIVNRELSPPTLKS